MSRREALRALEEWDAAYEDYGPDHKARLSNAGSDLADILRGLLEVGDDAIGLADGTDVPRICVEAIDKFGYRWPGSTFPMARAGIAAAVLKARGLL